MKSSVPFFEGGKRRGEVLATTVRITSLLDFTNFMITDVCFRSNTLRKPKEWKPFTNQLPWGVLKSDYLLFQHFMRDK